MLKITLVSATLVMGYQTLLYYRNKMVEKNRRLKTIACHGGCYDS